VSETKLVNKTQSDENNVDADSDAEARGEDAVEEDDGELCHIVSTAPRVTEQ
jgi:hypothetical protein